MARLTADELATEGAPAACLQALRDATGARDEPMERHTVRCFVIAERLAREQGCGIDRELLLCASFLHDVGIFAAVATREQSYVADGRERALAVVAPYGWSAARRRLLGDTIYQHHAHASREHLGHEVELMRRADLVDASGGLVTFGLGRAWLRGLNAAVPRRGLYLLLARAVGRMLRERPATLLDVFTPPNRRVPEE